MSRENDAILAVAVVAVGLGILLLAPGLGILFFIVMIPILIMVRRNTPIESENIDPIQLDNPLAAPRASLQMPAGTQWRRQPTSVLVQICFVFISMIAASIAFGVTCTAGVFSTVFIADAMNIDDQWAPFVLLLIPLASLAAAIFAFVFLFARLIKNR